MVSILLPISNSCGFISKRLVSVQYELIPVCINVTSMTCTFFTSESIYKYLSAICGSFVSQSLMFMNLIFLTRFWFVCFLYLSLLFYSSEKQSVSSSLRDSSQYSDRSQQCCSLESLQPSFFPKRSSPCTNHLVTVPRAPITIGIIFTFMIHSFFISLEKSRYLSLFSHSFNFTPWSTGTAKSIILQVHTFCLIIMRSGRLTELSWSVCISISQRSLSVSFSRTDSWLYIYHFSVWSNFNFLNYSQWITLPTQSCLVLYSFCANLLHSLIMWLILSSLLSNNISAVLFRLIYSRFDIVSPYGVVLCCY